MVVMVQSACILRLCVCVRARACVCVCVCEYVFVYVCMYVCVHVWTFRRSGVCLRVIVFLYKLILRALLYSNFGYYIHHDNCLTYIFTKFVKPFSLWVLNLLNIVSGMLFIVCTRLCRSDLFANMW